MALFISLLFIRLIVSREYVDNLVSTPNIPTIKKGAYATRYNNTIRKIK